MGGFWERNVAQRVRGLWQDWTSPQFGKQFGITYVDPVPVGFVSLVSASGTTGVSWIDLAPLVPGPPSGPGLEWLKGIVLQSYIGHGTAAGSNLNSYGELLMFGSVTPTNLILKHFFRIGTTINNVSESRQWVLPLPADRRLYYNATVGYGTQQKYVLGWIIGWIEG